MGFISYFLSYVFLQHILTNSFFILFHLNTYWKVEVPYIFFLHSKLYLCIVDLSSMSCVQASSYKQRPVTAFSKAWRPFLSSWGIRISFYNSLVNSFITKLFIRTLNIDKKILCVFFSHIARPKLSILAQLLETMMPDGGGCQKQQDLAKGLTTLTFYTIERAESIFV